MMYAILEASGKQIWVKPGQFYDINKVTAQPGDKIRLDRILFLRKHETLIIGKPCIPKTYATCKVLKHLKGRKITVFKMKPKKNIHSKHGHRQQISRILIESIKTQTT
uniref:Large ribosomal subunit protein bL21c n=1 Tax=Liagoropsis maxima TaxID=1653392 RepID=A0A1G4NVH8_9FLOR|nr:Ribosomal protein L21 [Liagoropsis maxima]SCW22688.1 Ribosomal protein L21 [Liagoropsis maxima]